MLDQVIGGYGHGHGHGHGPGHQSSGYDYVDHKEFVSHGESGGGYYDQQGRYDHHVRVPGNHGRVPMAHMPVCDEEEEEFYESSQSHHTVNSNHNLHHQQPAPINFMAPASMGQPHHIGKMNNGWQGGHGMQHHGVGGYGMQGPRHGYMNPAHGGGGRTVVKASENWRVSNSNGGHHKVGWGSKGL